MKDEEYLKFIPLKRSWLEDIVAIFLKKPNGITEIDSIVNALLKTERDLKNEGECTVTRTINNFCINSEDIEKQIKHPIFKRISPSTYKLLSYPTDPNVINIQKIFFSETAYKKTWDFFVEKVRSNEKWSKMTNKEKLIAFAKNIAKNESLRNYIEVWDGSVSEELVEFYNKNENA